MRVSIACTSASSRILVRYTFTFGGNNSSQLAAFKIRDITGNFDVNMNTWQTEQLPTERPDIVTMMLMTVNS